MSTDVTRTTSTTRTTPTTPTTPTATSSRTTPAGPLPDLVTMPLLDRLVAQSLDQDYRHVAEQRRARRTQGGERGPRRIGRGTAAAVAAFGLLVAVAAAQTWRDAPSVASDRAALVEQIHRENTAGAAQQRTLRRLREQIAGRQQSLRTVTRSVSSAQARARRLGVRTGYAATSGPGVVATADDAAGQDGQIRDEDLAMLVDGLWGAGARAVSVNGIRLTAISPIRTSGQAIHVAFRPISPPYTVEALGSTASLQARFADTTHGLAWLSLVRTFGFAFEMHNEDDLRLPAASGPVLRHVRRADDQRPQKEVSPS